MGTLTAPDLLNASRSQLTDDVLVRLCSILQLNSTQFLLAENHYHAICDWLDRDESPLKRFHPELYPQGSVALGTTVKPQLGEEYDVDLVCELAVDPNSVPRPVVLLDLIEKRMRESEIYRSRLERKRRCLRVNYEHNFHLDILPACPDPGSGPNCLVVPDRDDVCWRASNPKGFIKWFKTKGALRPPSRSDGRAMAKDATAPLPQPETAEQKNTLQLSVQLFKRWRDIHYANNGELAPVSIVLTTLMGDHYYGEQSVSLNLANSVQSIIDSLPTVGRLVVVNPSHVQEDISERWEDPKAYAAFVVGLHEFRRQMSELSKAQDMGQQSVLLQRMFGEKFIKKAFEEQGETLQKYRDAQKMGTEKRNGIVALSSAATVPIPRNTFYGER
jgi:hypothetical protein